MLDPQADIQAAYYTRLNGAVTGILNAEGNVIPYAIPVYDSGAIPSDAHLPYIALGGFIATEIGEGSKQSYGWTVSATVQACSQMSNSYGGKAQVHQIAGEILQLIRTRSGSYIDAGQEWNIITTIVEEDNTEEFLTTGGLEVKRIIRFNHKVFQLVENG